MNNDLNNNKKNSYSGFERETSSGFASGSFNIGDNSYTHRHMNYSDNDDYTSDKPMSYSDNNDYSSDSPMSYNDDDNDYSSGKPMSYRDNNYYNSDRPMSYSENNNFSSGSSMNNNSFGGNLYNPEPDYDPNAPLYRPEPGEYDPNASLYIPSSASSFSSGSSFSSTSVATASPDLTRSNNKRMTIIIVTLALGVLIIVGFVIFQVMNKKETMKSFLESDLGKTAIEELRADILSNPEFIGFDSYMEGDDDVLVYEFIFKANSISKQEKSLMEASFKIQEEELKSTFRQAFELDNIKEFDIMYRYKNRKGDVLFEYFVDI